jgi:hypothetical protein
MSDLPDSISDNLGKVEDTNLYGKLILNYSKKELAAYIIWQNKEAEKRIEEKHEQLRIFRKRHKHIFSSGL